MGVVVVVAVFFPRPAARGALVAVLEGLLPAVHAEPGCLLYAIHEADDGSVVMIEKWSSSRDLESHGLGDPASRMRARVAGLIDRETRVVTMLPVVAGSSAQGVL